MFAKLLTFIVYVLLSDHSRVQHFKGPVNNRCNGKISLDNRKRMGQFLLVAKFCLALL